MLVVLLHTLPARAGAASMGEDQAEKAASSTASNSSTGSGKAETVTDEETIRAMSGPLLDEYWKDLNEKVDREEAAISWLEAEKDRAEKALGPLREVAAAGFPRVAFDAALQKARASTDSQLSRNLAELLRVGMPRLPPYPFRGFDQQIPPEVELFNAPPAPLSVPFPLGASQELVGTQRAPVPAELVQAARQELEDTDFVKNVEEYFRALLSATEASKVQEATHYAGQLEKRRSRLTKLQKERQVVSKILGEKSKGGADRSFESVSQMMWLLGLMFLLAIVARTILAVRGANGQAMRVINDRTLIEFGGMSFLLLTVIILSTINKLEAQGLAALLGTVAGYIFGKSSAEKDSGADDENGAGVRKKNGGPGGEEPSRKLSTTASTGTSEAEPGTNPSAHGEKNQQEHPDQGEDKP